MQQTEPINKHRDRRAFDNTSNQQDSISERSDTEGDSAK